MEQKRQEIIAQLERMKEGAASSLKNGGEYYVMHAECAARFADNVMELLAAEPAEGIYRLTIEEKGKQGDQVDCKAFVLISVNPNGKTINVRGRRAGQLEEFLGVYFALKKEMEGMERLVPELPAFCKIMKEIAGTFNIGFTGDENGDLLWRTLPTDEVDDET
ncbi:MAG: hypothetical protein IJX88_05240 [Clostridia bacterium]|nr:hypothetical protein [Clostridia bacterium]